MVAGYLLSTWRIFYLLPLVAGRTRTEFDDRLLESMGPDARRLVAVVTLNLATDRLVFASAGAKTLLADAYLVVGLALVLIIVFKGIKQAEDWDRGQATSSNVWAGDWGSWPQTQTQLSGRAVRPMPS